MPKKKKRRRFVAASHFGWSDDNTEQKREAIFAQFDAMTFDQKRAYLGRLIAEHG